MAAWITLLAGRKAAASAVISLVLLAAAGAFSLPQDIHAQTTAETQASALEQDWDRRWWLDKTARLLRDGEGLGPDDDVAELLTLPDDEVVSRFMADERFGDTILDFNMYYLGFKADDLKIDGRYGDHAFDFPNAITSAQEMLKGGDYLKLFDLQGPFFMAPLRTEALVDPLPVEDRSLTPPQLRAKVIAEFRSLLKKLTPAGGTPARPGPLCDRIEAIVNQDDDISNRFFRAFNDAEIFALMRGRLLLAPLETLGRIAEDECSRRNKAKIDVVRLTHAIERAIAQFDRAAQEIASFEPAVYRPRTVSEFKAFDLTAFGTLSSWLAFGYEQSAALVNSSTNFNRKRSAYVLKQFFCDDLTPVGVDDPMEHTRGEHGSTTSCFACHYKLDPMAGFFRNYGALFGDGAGSPDLVFDDLASTERRSYVDHWRAATGTGRKWDVGYVRSPRWSQQNAYGETMGDLTKIIRTAPEAKRCLMRRLVEYSVGADQTVDSGYLDELTNRFTADAKVNSSLAMKNAITSVVKSKAFMQRNRDPSVCYDLARGEAPGGKPPCRVDAILERNCSQCHDSAYGGEGNLDLTRWIPQAAGAAPSFPHFDSNMKQMSQAETLRMIAERLASSDARKRMPKNKAMTSQDRQELYLWAEQQLKAATAGDGK